MPISIIPSLAMPPIQPGRPPIYLAACTASDRTPISRQLDRGAEVFDIRPAAGTLPAESFPEGVVVSAAQQRLWGGRFAEAPDAATLRFMAGRDVTPSPPADAHLIADDLWSTAAHVTMLARQGLIPAAEARLLLDGLDELGRRHEQGQFPLDPAREDVHTNIELALSELCGAEAGGRVHTGRSRNDQVATAM